METNTLTAPKTIEQPIIKMVSPLNFLFFRTKIRVNELGSLVGSVARELYRDAVINDLEITGPVYWNYFGFTGDEEATFTLEIALPVSEIPKEYTGTFRLKRSDSFRCVAIRHEGSWYDMFRSYARLMQFAVASGCQCSDENREVYLNIDFLNPHANVTEIQLGII